MQRGGSLTWILLPRGAWAVLDDLLIGPQAQPPKFRPLSEGELAGPARSGWEVLDLAEKDSAEDEVLRAGTRLTLVGAVNRGFTSATIDQLVFTAKRAPHADKLITVGLVGRSPVHQGLAGALVVPAGEALERDVARKDGLLDLIEDALDELDGFTDGTEETAEATTEPAGR